MQFQQTLPLFLMVVAAPNTLLLSSSSFVQGFIPASNNNHNKIINHGRTSQIGYWGGKCSSIVLHDQPKGFAPSVADDEQVLVNGDDSDEDNDEDDKDYVYEIELNQQYDDNEEEEDDDDGLQLATMDTMQIKEKLLDLLPRMMGTPKEFALVESYVNTLEERYTPVQTLDFLNLAMCGDWQLLFSTNLAGGPKPNFRLRELFQSVQPNKLQGKVINECYWELSNEDNGIFDAYGTFRIVNSYSINQGARMVVELQDHVLLPERGSKLPKDVPGLVGLLHRAMPKEMFDPNDHAMDTTYLDGDLRIVRLTGPRFEGVRDIFIRRGAIEVNPTGTKEE